MKPKSKIWLEKNAKPVFGDGRYELLKAIKSEGSINRGAKKISMSYKQAWDEINLMEERLNFKLLQRRSGGVGGGGVMLTDAALKLVGDYDKFRNKATSAIKKAFREVFK